MQKTLFTTRRQSSSRFAEHVFRRTLHFIRAGFSLLTLHLFPQVFCHRREMVGMENGRVGRVRVQRHHGRVQERPLQGAGNQGRGIACSYQRRRLHARQNSCRALFRIALNALFHSRGVDSHGCVVQFHDRGGRVDFQTYDQFTVCEKSSDTPAELQACIARQWIRVARRDSAERFCFLHVCMT